MKMISPDGKVSIDSHPSKVDSLLNKGWKEEAALSKVKPKTSIWSGPHGQQPACQMRTMAAVITCSRTGTSRSSRRAKFSRTRKNISIRHPTS